MIGMTDWTGPYGTSVRKLLCFALATSCTWVGTGETRSKTLDNPTMVHPPPTLLGRLPRAFLLMLQPASSTFLPPLYFLFSFSISLSLSYPLLPLSASTYWLPYSGPPSPPPRVGSKSSAVGQVTSLQTTTSIISSDRRLAALFSTSIPHSSSQ